MAAAERAYLPKRTALAPAAAAAEPARPLTLVIEDEPNSLDTIRNTPFGWQLAPLTQGYLFLVDEPRRARPRPGARAARPAPTAASRPTAGASPTRSAPAAGATARRSTRATSASRSTRCATRARPCPTPRPWPTWPGYRVPRARHARGAAEGRPSAPFVSSFLTLGANDPFAILPRHIAATYASLDRSSLDTIRWASGRSSSAHWQRGERLSLRAQSVLLARPGGERADRRRDRPDAQTRLLLAAHRRARPDRGDRLRRSTSRARSRGRRVVQRDDQRGGLPAVQPAPPGAARAAGAAAIAMAIDRRRLAATVYRGTLVPSDAIQLDPLYRTDAAPAAVSIRRRRGGCCAPRHLTLDFAIAGEWRNSANAAVQIAANLAAVGVTAQIHSYSEAEFWGPKDRGGILESGTLRSRADVVVPGARSRPVVSVRLRRDAARRRKFDVLLRSAYDADEAAERARIRPSDCARHITETRAAGSSPSCRCCH